MSVIVYTAIFGDSDSLKPAPAGADECVCFTDDARTYQDSLGWTIRRMSKVANPRRDAWALRCSSHIVLGPHRTSVWVDASFTLTNLPALLKDAGKAPIAALRHHERFSPYAEAKRLVKIGQSDRDSIRRQIADYQAMNFDLRHLSISCVLVRENSQRVERFNCTWLEQIEKYPGDNTQVSLDFSAWRHGMEIKALRGNRHDNPYARHDHADHRQRRRPYQPLAMAAAVDKKHE